MSDTVVSGVPYAVATVDGRRPFSLDDFIGAHRLRISQHGQQSLVDGLGLRTGPDSVMFTEKRGGVDGKDAREWTITGRAADGFRAEHAAKF